MKKGYKGLILVTLGVLFCVISFGVHGYGPACTMSSVAIAADQTAAVSTGPTLGEAVKGVVDNAIIPLVVSLVGALVSLVLVKLKNKYNIELKAETEAWISKQAENAVQMVAEKAAAKLKYEKIKLTGNQKLDTAVAMLVTKVPTISRDQADQYIHAALARIPGLGATGDQSLVVGAAPPLQAVVGELSS